MSLDLSKIIYRINEEIADLKFGESPSELYDPITYIMNLGGKRLRPLLGIFGYYLFNDDIEKIIKPSIALEVFHNFTLMHDDIMDQAPLRRGQPTVHEKWNSNIAILSGDVMLVKAYDFLIDIPSGNFKEIVKRFNRCASEVCEGQQLDMNYQESIEVTEQQYLLMIKLKTAVLLGFSLEFGSLLAGATSQDQVLLKSFGENIGIGFQLKDDLLDVYADKNKFGKQVGGDILVNKKTFLLIKAIEMANTAQRASLIKWLSNFNFEPQEKIQAVTKIFNELGIRELTEQKMYEYFSRAFQDLEALSAPPSKKQELKFFAQSLIEREN